MFVSRYTNTLIEMDCWWINIKRKLYELQTSSDLSAYWIDRVFPMEVGMLYCPMYTNDVCSLTHSYIINTMFVNIGEANSTCMEFPIRFGLGPELCFYTQYYKSKTESRGKGLTLVIVKWTDAHEIWISVCVVTTTYIIYIYFWSLITFPYKH